MTLGELISRFRSAANDKVKPYFWSDDELTQWLNEAEAEAVVRGRLIHESSNQSMCMAEIESGQSEYRLHSAMYEITSMAWHQDGQEFPSPISLTSSEVMDSEYVNWRYRTGVPTHAIQNDKSVRLIPTPSTAGFIRLEGYRLPKTKMEDMDDTPEINHAHHRHLVCWAMYIGFSIPDAELFDQRRADIAKQEFDAYFGLQVDSDMRRTTRHDVQHHVEPFWP